MTLSLIVTLRRSRLAWLTAFVLSAWLFLLSFAWAQQAVPQLSARIVDTTGVLDSADLARIETRLARLEEAVGSQMAVLIVSSTQPEDIASYANRVANAWKLGRRNEGDGILLVIARRDGKVRIETAKAVEGAIPDLAAQQIIDEQLLPALRQRQYAPGILAAADAVQTRLAAEKYPQASDRENSAKDQPAQRSTVERLLNFEWMDFFIFLFFAVPIGGSIAKQVFGNKLGSFVTGGVVSGMAFWVTASAVIATLAFAVAMFVTLSTSLGRTVSRRGGYSSGGWSSGGGSSGSGNWGSNDGAGWSSGGGGDFGGGGASGDFGGDSS